MMAMALAASGRDSTKAPSKLGADFVPDSAKLIPINIDGVQEVTRPSSSASGTILPHMAAHRAAESIAATCDQFAQASTTPP
jgi:hypothetical protein